MNASTLNSSFLSGYDTSAHVAEETCLSHNAVPYAMVGTIINCIILGKKVSQSVIVFYLFEEHFARYVRPFPHFILYRVK